jgi:hypothetical protein
MSWNNKEEMWYAFPRNKGIPNFLYAIRFILNTESQKKTASEKGEL